MKINNDGPAQFPAPGELRLTRLLPGPIERVWAYLTDPEKRARWFAAGVVEPKTGGKAEFVMHHAKIAPGETPPARYKHVHDQGVTFDGRVLRYEPPRVLAYTFGGEDSDVTFELTPQGNQVLLVLTHRTRGEDRPELTNYASGWHTHFSLLIALLEERPQPPFWATHARLKAEYDLMLAAAGH
jgi:uncharacterized protein YndB with AHSA1/START domain